MYTYFYLLLLLVGFVHIDGVERESTIHSPVTQNYSEISTDELKKTLMEAITEDHERLVSEILAHPEAKNFNQRDLRRALELAAKNNYVSIAHRLIQAGADIKDEYCPALEDAAEKGCLDMVKALLPVQGCGQCHPLGFNPFNGNRDRALIKAARNGHVDVMKELLNAEANVNYHNSFGNIALVEAAKEGHIGAVKELLKANANVNAFDKNGMTALIIAMHLQNVGLIRELLKAPDIDVSQHIEAVQRRYKYYLEMPDSVKAFFADSKDKKTDLEIFELFKPFMKL